MAEELSAPVIERGLDDVHDAMDIRVGHPSRQALPRPRRLLSVQQLLMELLPTRTEIRDEARMTRGYSVRQIGDPHRGKIRDKDFSSVHEHQGVLNELHRPGHRDEKPGTSLVRDLDGQACLDCFLPQLRHGAPGTDDIAVAADRDSRPPWVAVDA